MQKFSDSSSSSSHGKSKNCSWKDKIRFTHHSLNQLDPLLLINLTSFEKKELDSLFTALNSLTQPKRPPGAFNIYLNDLIVTLKQTHQYKNFKVAEVEAFRKWKQESDQVKAEYETRADLAFKEYNQKFLEYSNKSEAIREKIDEIKARADFSAIVKKKISPYRVFKKENAASIKEEFPNMKSQER